MKRLPFIAALFGIRAVAQDRSTVKAGGCSLCVPPNPAAQGIGTVACWKDSASGEVQCVSQEGRFIIPEWKLSGKAKNNQCPTCGTMAEPYIRRQTDCCGSDEQLKHGGLIACVSEARMCDTETRRQVPGGCKHCNAAFWQDAER